MAGLAIEDPPCPGSPNPALDSVQQLVTLRGLGATLAGIRVPVSPFLQSEVGPDDERTLSTLSRETSLEIPAPAGGRHPGTHQPFSVRMAPSPSASLAGQGSQQLSPWHIFGLALLLQECFQLPLPKAAVCGPTGPGFGLVPVTFSILHNLRLVQDVSLSLARHPCHRSPASELFMPRPRTLRGPIPTGGGGTWGDWLRGRVCLCGCPKKRTTQLSPPQGAFF